MPKPTKKRVVKKPKRKSRDTEIAKLRAEIKRLQQAVSDNRVTVIKDSYM